MLLLARGVAADPARLAMATRTLDAMWRGGIHDQLGGGFHRYALDRDVRVSAAALLSADRARLGALAAVAPAYEAARRTPAVGRVVSWGAPLLDLEASRPSDPIAS